MDLIAVASKTPMPVLRLGIQVASFWLSMFPNKGVTTWRRNVAPLLGREPSRAETRRAVESWGRNLSQSLHLDRWSPDRINAAVTISDADLERVESYCQKGAVFVLPHMGNWDLAGAWINQRGFPVTSVAENL
ncbi:MAG: phosphatidylinositol mannoside acyltransferase, partial [Propionibacteriales bacterium]